MTTSTKTSPCHVTTDASEAYSIAKEAYFYFYPLLLMEVTRKQCTNSEAGKIQGFAPANSFSHIRAYPEADFKTVVRPNFDTLYSVAWLDLSQEPQVVSVPDSNNRYYLLPFLDMWSDVFAVPGWRTTGTTAAHYALVAPGWSGTIPGGIEKIEAPTSWVWCIGRTKTDGPDDYSAVHKFQDGMSITPLSSFGKNPAPPAFKADPAVDMKTPPMAQVDSMSAEAFFALASQLLKSHKPHVTDYSISQRIKKLGLSAESDFNASLFSADVKAKLQQATTDALKTMKEKLNLLGRQVNGWTVNTDSIGVYGNSYLKRAMVAMVGLGANQPDDAVYPLNNTDADGKPLDGKNNYVLHFDKTELPPTDAFWSVTMYDKEGFQAANSINRFAISSWMPLAKNADGSLDIYIQNANPGADKEANWLPAPKGELGVTLRLYAPKLEVLDGSWNPPAIRKA